MRFNSLALLGSGRIFLKPIGNSNYKISSRAAMWPADPAFPAFRNVFYLAVRLNSRTMGYLMEEQRNHKKPELIVLNICRIGGRLGPVLLALLLVFEGGDGSEVVSLSTLDLSPEIQSKTPEPSLIRAKLVTPLGANMIDSNWSHFHTMIVSRYTHEHFVHMCKTTTRAHAQYMFIMLYVCAYIYMCA